MTGSVWRVTVGLIGLAAVVSLASCREPSAPPPPLPPPRTDFNLGAFGAVGDGIHDDAPALQRALDAIAEAGGGTLTVPAGRYALVTQVAKDFSGLARSVSIRGVTSSTPIETKGNGKRLTQGLDLTSEFVIKAGHPNVSISLSGLTTLLITDVVFIGTPEATSDARIVLAIRGVSNATIRHSEFYGLSTQSERGAIVHADDSGLTIDQTAFLGTTGNSGVDNAVILATKWKSVSLTNSVFVDYGERPGYFGKLGLAAAYAWITIADTAPVQPAAPAGQAAPRREATIRNVFMDEGAFMAIASIPERYANTPTPADLIHISDSRVNVSNLGSAAIHVDRGARQVMVERAAFGFSRNAGPAVNVDDVDEAILDNVTCTESVKTIAAGSTVGKLTVTNSTCKNVQSQARTTRVFRTAPAAGPVQYVRQRFLAALGTEPPARMHHDWSSRLLLCETDQGCLAQREQELAAALAQAATR